MLGRQRLVDSSLCKANGMAPAKAAADPGPMIVQSDLPFPAGGIGCLDHLVLCVSVSHEEQTAFTGRSCCRFRTQSQKFYPVIFGHNIYTNPGSWVPPNTRD
jgi:hypothetical protein